MIKSNERSSSGTHKKRAVFVVLSPLTPIPSSCKFISSSENNLFAAATPINLNLELHIIMMDLTVSGAPSFSFL